MVSETRGIAHLKWDTSESWVYGNILLLTSSASHPLIEEYAPATAPIRRGGPSTWFGDPSSV